MKKNITMDLAGSIIMKEWNSKEFEQEIQYTFQNKSLILLAFTHSSYANENKKGLHENNERLEFLGDAVLDLVISEQIYNNYPEMPEGELTKLRAGVVCEATIASKARNLHFGEYLLLGHGEEASGGRERESILADVFEAVIGAVYLDGGMKAASYYILSLLSDEIEQMKLHFKELDFKTRLQEDIQKFSKSAIIYEIIDEKGPDHDKVFVAQVIHEDQVLGVGEGKSKKEAEQSAAGDALNKDKKK